MKIKEINIASFGGIKNLKITPENGFNVIYGDNENGKSTVMSFIKMMFYGSGRNSSDISKNIRKKYTPWDGSQMAGSIDFEHSGRLYRIEREFRKSDATDKVTLCDLDLGTRVAAPSDIGTKFFSLTAAGFERSVFIGQFGFPEGDPEGEIGKRLSNIVLTGDETVSFETVNDRLSKARTALMSKSGTAGAYDKNIKEIGILTEKLQNSTLAYENYNTVKAQLQKTAAEIADMQQSADKLKKKISSEQDIRNAAKLKNLIDVKNELDKLNEELKLSDGKLADESYLKKLQFCISRQSAAKARLDTLQNEIELLSNSISDGESENERRIKKQNTENELAEYENRRAKDAEKLSILKTEARKLQDISSNPDSFKKKANSLLLNIGSVVFILGAIAVFLLYSKGILFALSVIGAALGLVIFVLGFIVRPTDKKAYLKHRTESEQTHKLISELEISLNNTVSEISVLKARLEAINTSLSGNTETQENNKRLLIERKEKLPDAELEYSTETQSLNSLISRFKADFSPEEIPHYIEEISKKATKQKELKQQISYILKDVGNISYDEAAEKLKDMESTCDISADFEEIKSEYENLLKEISDKKSSAAADAVRAEEAISREENPETLRRKISELKSISRSQKEYCDCLQLAMEALGDANIEVRRSFGGNLEKESALILNKLTDGKYENMSVSKTFDIAVEECGRFGSREIDYLSSGTADQAYLSLRLAISGLLAGDGEALPILMDDALAQYDDKRTKTALKFLNEYSQNCQIILFTCHKNISDTAQSQGAKTFTL